VRNQILQALQEIEDGIVEIRNVARERHEDDIDARLYGVEMRIANLRVKINVREGMGDH
jgi:hypothetical protein